MNEVVKEFDSITTHTLYLDDYDLVAEITDRRDPQANYLYHGPLGFQVVVKNVSSNEFYGKNFLSGLFETISERITGNLILETQSRLGKDTPESFVTSLLLPRYIVKEYGYSSEERKIFANFTKAQRGVGGRAISG